MNSEIKGIELWFALSSEQRQHYNRYHCGIELHEISMRDFKKITKSKKLHNKLIELKRSYFRLVS